MRRQREDTMQVNVAGFRRNIKNLAHNYSDAQKKVREATSNDPWGPSSTLMSEIADLTYNVVAFTEIMQMIWKRLNDHGRNWRHVYKALVLLEYLIKTGTEKVAMQCKENIFAIQTLKDFQYFEETKDQGLNVREKAKQLVILLKDDERLRNERARALKAKERFAQAASGFGSDGNGLDAMSPSSPSFPSGFQDSWSSCEAEPSSRDYDTARPQTIGEEELQLQLALAMSREEAEQEEQRRRSDDVRLQLALSQSEQEFKSAVVEKPSHMLDLLDVSLGPTQPPGSATMDPWGFPQPGAQASPPRRPQTLDVFYSSWGSPQQPQQQDIWSSPTSPSPVIDPWAPVSQPPPPPAPLQDPWRPRQDPWSPSTDQSTSPGDLDEFDIITNRERPANNANNINNNANGGLMDPFELNLLGDSLDREAKVSEGKKTPHSFLGENSALVNLDNLVTVSAKPALGQPQQLMPQQPVAMATVNPFNGSSPGPAQPNLFQQQQQAVIRPSMNQIRQPFASQPNPFLS